MVVPYHWMTFMGLITSKLAVFLYDIMPSVAGAFGYKLDSLLLRTLKVTYFHVSLVIMERVIFVAIHQFKGMCFLFFIHKVIICCDLPLQCSKQWGSSLEVIVSIGCHHSCYETLNLVVTLLCSLQLYVQFNKYVAIS